MSLAILVNGEERDHVSVLDRGFLLGDGVFETMRTYGRACHRLGAHLARLSESCSKIGIAIPVDAAELEAEIAHAILRAGHEECYVRVIISRGEGLGLDPRSATAPTRVVLAGPLPVWPSEMYHDGIDVGTVRAYRATDWTQAAGAKVSSYLGHILAYASVQSRAHDALMVNEGGEITEGAAANVFIVRDGELQTPPLSMGILAGITRAEVLAIALERGYPSRERILFARDIERADEAFLTSSLREIVPIRSIDGQRIGTGKAGARTRELLDAYRTRARTLDPSADFP